MDEKDVKKVEIGEKVEINKEGVESSKIIQTEVSYESTPENKELIKKDFNIQTNNISDDELLRQRKEKFKKFIKNKQWWVFGLLIIAIILGVYIRSMPMYDHGGKPGLWDFTTDSWTLGPDLDPWLFYRNAKTIVEQGELPAIDMMRNVPRGFDNTMESQLLAYMIAWTYHGLNFFGIESSIEYAAVIFPVIMFALTIISFFFFVREIFIRKSQKSILNANIIALISTFFMIVAPVFLSRTIAGIPEKESAAFFFMFLSLYLFLKAWKSEKINQVILLGILSGISTGLMGLIWGGILYLFIPIALASLIALIFNKMKYKQFVLYFLWAITPMIIMTTFSSRYTFQSMLTSISSGLVFFTLFIMIVHLIIWNTRLSQIRFIKNFNLPRSILSFIIAFILIIILSFIFAGPTFIIEKIGAIHQTIFKPVLGRWNITVAENRQPNFKEWSQSFGPFIKNIPIMFWMFFAGSVVLFRKMMKPLKNKDSWTLVLLYIFFIMGLIFSRYSGDSLFNGDNFISKAFYYISLLLFAISAVYMYIKYSKAGDSSFEKIRFEYIFLFSLFILTLFTARGAVRLIMVLGPIATIFVSFLIMESFNWFRRQKDETMKLIVGVIVILILIAGLYTFTTYYGIVKSQAYGFVPSSYNLQWQNSMEWVRENTSEDAVFGHWWDYGYWVQSIGNRATVLDGGNAIAYWNYLMGRLVLTGDNQADALEFLYNHNTTHFLIDSTDIGKYTAFSSIGSNEEYDRYSWFGTFIQDERQTLETKNKTLLVYSGGTNLDEDLIITEEGQEILLPKGAAGIGAIILPFEISEEGESYGQPQAIIVYQGIQHKVDLRYLYIRDSFVDFESGIDAAAFVMPMLEQQNGGVAKNDQGAAMYISPRLFRGMLAQIYLLNDPLEKFSNFNLAHTESAMVVNSLRSQGMELPEFIYFQGIQGPIKIWEVEYTGKEEIKEEYLDKDYTKYIDWKL
jgi:asparagine N-glycosylation enzyme membrane subunit Stt3